jgi:hypothetical protein
MITREFRITDFHQGIIGLTLHARQVESVVDLMQLTYRLAVVLLLFWDTQADSSETKEYREGAEDEKKTGYSIWRDFHRGWTIFRRLIERSWGNSV